MARTVPEWIGKSDDHRAPGKVRDRIMAREGNRCHLCTREIVSGEKWDLDHVVALINGGENREANLKPAHRKCHVEKTAADVAEKAKTAAKRMRHLNIRPAPAKPIQSAPFPKTAKAERRQTKPSLPPRRLFEETKP